jgi:hypothetical protein
MIYDLRFRAALALFLGLWTLDSGLWTCLAADRITVSVTVTNATTNGMSFTLNGSTRTFTNAVFTPASDVLTNSAATGTKTNLLEQIRGYAFTQVQNQDDGATNFNLIGNASLAMSATVSGAWGFVTYSTQTVATLTGVRVPVSGEPSAAVQTNVASAIVAALNMSANTNEIQQASKAATQLAGLTNTQTFAGAKTFTNTLGDWRGGITNSPGIVGTFGAVTGGVWRSGVAISPTFTNTVNYGNAISSPGSAADSEQFGTSASAAGEGSQAFGLGATAAQELALAVGNSTFAMSGSSAFGPGAVAYGTNQVALGFGATAGSNDLNSVAIGSGAATTVSNQIRLGTSSGYVSIPGGLHVAGSITNPATIGTNTVDGHIKFIRLAVSSLANGNNAAVPIATNTFVEVSGPSAAFTLNGIANGSDGRLLIVLNQTGFDMTVAHQSGTDPTAANRIINMTGADRTTTGNGAAMLIYSGAASRWILISLDP